MKNQPAQYVGKTAPAIRPSHWLLAGRSAVSVAAAAQFGFEGPSAGGPAFVAGEGTPHALIIVPVGAHMSSDHSAADRASRVPR
jgi:hypothetical protein